MLVLCIYDKHYKYLDGNGKTKYHKKPDGIIIDVNNYKQIKTEYNKQLVSRIENERIDERIIKDKFGKLDDEERKRRGGLRAQITHLTNLNASAIELKAYLPRCNERKF